MEKIRDYSIEEFNDLVLNSFKNVSDLELMVLKGHILIEFTLNCYLEILSGKSQANFFKERFTFDTKIKLLDHFGGIGKGSEDFVNSLKLLNKVRNGIAHNLIINEQLLKEFIHSVNLITEKEYVKEKVIHLYKEDDIHRQFLLATIFICGMLFGNYYDRKQIKEI